MLANIVLLLCTLLRRHDDQLSFLSACFMMGLSIKLQFECEVFKVCFETVGGFFAENSESSITGGPSFVHSYFI